MAAYIPLEIRFWEKVKKGNPNECWEWIASLRNGYGEIKIKGKSKIAHRIAWELEYGTIPETMSVLHKCDNPSCCNPNHLFLGTQYDNIQDRIEKGRSAKINPRDSTGRFIAVN